MINCINLAIENEKVLFLPFNIKSNTTIIYLSKFIIIIQIQHNKLINIFLAEEFILHPITYRKKMYKC